MELVAVIVIVLGILAATYVRLQAEKRKTRENESLKRTIKGQELMAQKKDREYLRNADVDTTVDFLNSLSDKDGED